MSNLSGLNQDRIAIVNIVIISFGAYLATFLLKWLVYVGLVPEGYTAISTCLRIGTLGLILLWLGHSVARKATERKIRAAAAAGLVFSLFVACVETAQSCAIASQAGRLHISASWLVFEFAILAVVVTGMTFIAIIGGAVGARRL